MTIDHENCAYRVDGHASAASFPYRAKIGGLIVRNADGTPRKFATLWAACVYIAENRPARA